MRIVMDFDGVFTDPTDEGSACSQNFRDQILSLKLKKVGLETAAEVDAWLGELRARLSSRPFDFGWRSEGRISAFAFEDPFIRNIGMADFLDHLVELGDNKARTVLGHLITKDKIQSFGALSEWAFHQLKMKKSPDPQAKAWVEDAIQKGHEVTVVSNSATEKIEEFLNQSGFGQVYRPQVRGGAKKFGLGQKAKGLTIQKGKPGLQVDTDRPWYEKALLELKPQMVIGDVFCLDLALPIRLHREDKLNLSGGALYRIRDYTPSPMVELVTGRGNLFPEVRAIREWSQIKL
jgi:hypothetical protein